MTKNQNFIFTSLGCSGLATVEGALVEFKGVAGSGCC